MYGVLCKMKMWDPSFKQQTVGKKKTAVKNTKILGLAWWSSDWGSALLIQGAQVWSLVKELDPTCCN